MLTNAIKNGLSKAATPTTQHTPIPSPPGVPGLGNVNAIDEDLPIKSLHELSQKYGAIYELNVLGASHPL